MDEPENGQSVAVLSSRWGDGTEAAFVIRSLAGAISRHRRLDVFTVGHPGPPRADGAFEVNFAGQARAQSWPVTAKLAWPHGAPSVILANADDYRAIALARRSAPKATMAIVTVGGKVSQGAQAVLAVAPGHRDAAIAAGARPELVHDVGLHVPVNRIAAEHRHNGIGFIDYLLILTDRRMGTGRSDDALPPSAAWVAARFPRQHVVVVEDAAASVWQWRSLRGVIAVDSRTDLWRLMAHARTMIDLRPGSHLARECIESLRFATPIIAPAGSVGAELAEAGGGLWYRDPAELLGCIEWLEDPEIRQALGVQGRRLAEALYGDPDAFVSRMGKALTSMTEVCGSDETSGSGLEF